MRTFVVEREVDRTPAVDLFGLAAASQRVAAEMMEDGDRILYLGSAYLPESGVCLCLFSARNAEVVALHSAAARLPVRRISDAMALGALAGLLLAG